jgi:UDP-glucuronate 4-epimerase
MAPWIFTSRILAGEPIQVFNHGEMRRDFTYISDIVAGVLAALDRPPADDGEEKAGGSMQPHALYNIGNSHPEELGRFIDIIEAACGRAALRDYQPMQPGDVVATAADISAIERDLGFAPRTPIDVGVPRFVDWFRTYHANV